MIFPGSCLFSIEAVILHLHQQTKYWLSMLGFIFSFNCVRLQWILHTVLVRLCEQLQACCSLPLCYQVSITNLTYCCFFASQIIQVLLKLSKVYVDVQNTSGLLVTLEHLTGDDTAKSKPKKCSTVCL